VHKQTPFPKHRIHSETRFLQSWFAPKLYFAGLCRSQLCVVLMACLPPPHRRRCSRGWPKKPLFTNINFTRHPFLQFWFAPKLRSTVSCYLSTLCCTPGVFVLPPTPPHTLCCMSGWPNKFLLKSMEVTWNLLVNHFCNFGLPLSSVLQFCVAPQLCVVLIGCPCTMRCSRGWPNKHISRNMGFSRAPILKCWFAPKLGFYNFELPLSSVVYSNEEGWKLAY